MSVASEMGILCCDGMSCVDLMGEALEVKRFLPSIMVDGRAKNAPQYEIITITAMIQPLNQKELQRLDEGLRNAGTVKVYTTSELKTSISSECKRPDEFTHNGVDYQVYGVDDWKGFGGYYKILATRLTY